MILSTYYSITVRRDADDIRIYGSPWNHNDFPITTVQGQRSPVTRSVNYVLNRSWQYKNSTLRWKLVFNWYRPITYYEPSSLRVQEIEVYIRISNWWVPLDFDIFVYTITELFRNWATHRTGGQSILKSGPRNYHCGTRLGATNTTVQQKQQTV